MRACAHRFFTQLVSTSNRTDLVNSSAVRCAVRRVDQRFRLHESGPVGIAGKMGEHSLILAAAARIGESVVSGYDWPVRWVCIALLVQDYGVEEQPVISAMRFEVVRIVGDPWSLSLQVSLCCWIGSQALSDR